MQSLLSENQVMVRLNGVCPDLSRVGDMHFSERALEINNSKEKATTSCSIISSVDGDHNDIFHILVDIGPGVVNSLQKISSPGKNIFHLPDALLITHSHEGHVAELPLLLSLYDKDLLKVYCTKDTMLQLFARFPDIKHNHHVEFIEINSGQDFKVGSFIVTAISVNHFDYNKKSSLPGCVIFAVALKDIKIIIAWDFLTINGDIDQRLLWNPDILILGTETYNSHPSSGLISIGDAITLIRRWNAKNSYIVHYSGLMDFEDRTNQWFRGPQKPLNSSALQQNIDEQLRIAGDDGKFVVTVAKEGMTQVLDANEKINRLDSFPLENPIMIEGLQKYVFKIEMRSKDNKLFLEIEDRINRYSLEFDSPYRIDRNEDIVCGKAVKGMLTRGPELKMETITKSGAGFIHIEVIKGKKFMFRDDIAVSDLDLKRIRNFIRKYIPPK
ncbi:MAG: MBL fold metallo-hydrolase [Candidatus Eiseniibacteriota bacterium]